ncbi:dipeptide/oligopeptide/nickel ABC transporter permease [Microbacterium sp. HM58-2]|nr:dipeptide/oligopeptide/nickel ABC transporter permease [Microbacterium sp. HM58-2]
MTTQAIRALQSPSWRLRLFTGWPGYLLRRLGGLLLSFALLALGAFLIVPLLPGDPAAAMLGANASPEAIAALRERLHLDDPLWRQFIDFIAGLFSGDLGTSFRFGTPVMSSIAGKLTYTANLALTAIIVVLVVAVPLGMLIGVLTRGGRRPGLSVVFGAVAGFLASVPGYVLGTIFILVFAIWLRILPAAGATESTSSVLPVLSLAIGPAFAVARVVRQETSVVLQQDFMRTARGRRLRTARLYLVHALPNLMTSTLTLAGLILAGIVGAAVIIENVFNYPGLGSEIVQAIIYKDYPMVQGIILVIGTLAILVNLLIDIILGLIDPRTLGGRNV